MVGYVRLKREIGKINMKHTFLRRKWRRFPSKKNPVHTFFDVKPFYMDDYETTDSISINRIPNIWILL